LQNTESPNALKDYEIFAAPPDQRAPQFFSPKILDSSNFP
jgi:hypothetical protein